MGLKISHGCWDGSYGAFNEYRRELARMCQIPLDAMRGHGRGDYDLSGRVRLDIDMAKIEQAFGARTGRYSYEGTVMVHYAKAMNGVDNAPWSVPLGLRVLLHHSDCGGRIRWWEARDMAMELAKVLRRMKSAGFQHESRSALISVEVLYTITKRMAIGGMKAYAAREDLVFT